MQDRTVVKDSQITAVSYWDNIEVYQSYHGRLFNTGTYGGSWIAGRPAFNQNSLFTNNQQKINFTSNIKVISFLQCITDKDERWIEVNYQREKTIYGVVTQGRNNYNNYVTSYNVLYKTDDSSNFKYILDKNGEEKVGFFL